MFATIDWNEIAVVMTLGTFVMVWVVILITLGVKLRRQGNTGRTGVSAQPGAQPHAATWQGGDESAYVVARITQRFCPRCRAPLAADAPEGLCPACLMAGGLASAVQAGPLGTAVTTPPSGFHPLTVDESADLAQRFPQLEILELLGRGGMGAVYKARQKHLDRIIALKVIPPEAAKDPAFAERFQREARALARMNHPNIVTVYDFGQTGDLYWLLMEYVDGVNLRHTLRAQRLQPAEALAIVPQVCDALQYAHDQGVVHRDIKPENVLLDRTGRVKIADFGLAKMLGTGPDNFTLTQTQQVMGTPRYMAPEQIEKPTSVDHRADIYSLGVVLYEMLTGELPIGRFEPPSHKVQLDVRIDQVVLRTLEKEPDRRYQRASQLKTELVSAAPPVWHTPAPAVKQMPGSPPLGEVLAVAIGMVLGVLVMTGGLAAGVYALASQPLFSGPWWGWMGGAFGCFVGGFGSLAGSYNTYRQLRGAEDLMRSPRTTWFDWTIRGYLVFGLALVAIAVIFLLRGGELHITQPLLTIAALVVFQAGLFMIFRVLLRPAAPARTIAMATGRAAMPQQSDWVAQTVRTGGCVLVSTVAIVVLLLCTGTLAYLAIPAVQGVREAARTAQSSNNLKQIGIALHNYHDVYGSFPPAVVTDDDGKTLYSGRVLLLPFLDQKPLYDSIDLTQAWDSPRNLPLTQTHVRVFEDPAESDRDPSFARTNYRFVTGAGTMFESGKTITMSDIRDGTGNTVAMIETQWSETNWAQPDEFDASFPTPLPPSSYGNSSLVLFADGSVTFMVPSNLSPLDVRAMATIAGGETNTPPR